MTAGQVIPKIRGSAFIAGFEDVAVVSKAIEQGSRHLGIAEDAGPFAEAQVGGDHDAGALVELAEQMEQQGPAGWAEGEIAQFIQDDEVELEQAFGQLPSLVGRLFLFQRIDQIDGGEEAYFPAVVLDSLDAKGGGDVAFPGAGPTDQHDVVGAVHEVAAVELTHQSFVDLAGGKVEAGQVLVSREAGGLDLIGDRADLALGHFCLEQLGEHRLTAPRRLVRPVRSAPTACAIRTSCGRRHHADGGWRGMPPGSQHARISLSVVDLALALGSLSRRSLSIDGGAGGALVDQAMQNVENMAWSARHPPEPVDGA
jgi:hypothetical protein